MNVNVSAAHVHPFVVGDGRRHCHLTTFSSINNNQAHAPASSNDLVGSTVHRFVPGDHAQLHGPRVIPAPSSRSPSPAFVLASSSLSSPKTSQNSQSSGLLTFFKLFETINVASLRAIAVEHGMDVSIPCSASDLGNELVLHFTNCLCKMSSASSCLNIVEESSSHSKSADELKIHILSSVHKNIRIKPLRRLLTLHDVPFDIDDSLSRLHSKLKTHITALKKGKSSEEAAREYAEKLSSICSEWPQLVPDSLKQHLISAFCEATSLYSVWWNV